MQNIQLTRDYSIQPNNQTTQTYYAILGDRTIKLEPKQHSLLDLLLSAYDDDRAVNYDDVAFACWDWQTMVSNPPDNNNVSILIKNTRKRLRALGNRNHIVNVRLPDDPLYNTGYRFDPRGIPYNR